MAAAIAAAIVSTGCGVDDPYAGQPLVPTVPAKTVPQPPKLSASAINKQDQASPAERRRQSRVMDERPLLNRLPLTVDGVSVDIGGLAADNKTTVITVDRGRGTLSHARKVYVQLLHRYRDTGQSYDPRYLP